MIDEPLAALAKRISEQLEVQLGDLLAEQATVAAARVQAERDAGRLRHELTDANGSTAAVQGELIQAEVRIEELAEVVRRETERREQSERDLGHAAHESSTSGMQRDQLRHRALELLAELGALRAARQVAERDAEQLRVALRRRDQQAANLVRQVEALVAQLASAAAARAQAEEAAIALESQLP